jgi:hypothetical protein
VLNPLIVTAYFFLAAVPASFFIVFTLVICSSLIVGNTTLPPKSHSTVSVIMEAVTVHLIALLGYLQVIILPDIDR